jgi:hypothetical protein
MCLVAACGGHHVPCLVVSGTQDLALLHFYSDKAGRHVARVCDVPLIVNDVLKGTIYYQDLEGQPVGFFTPFHFLSRITRWYRGGKLSSLVRTLGLLTRGQAAEDTGQGAHQSWRRLSDTNWPKVPMHRSRTFL